MSALDRTIKRPCPECKTKVVYRYDAAGSSRPFDQDENGSLIPHDCTAPRERHVGGRVVHAKDS